MHGIQKLYEGGYLIHGTVGGRALQLTLLVGRDQTVLIDTGCASDVAALILPALAAVRVEPGRITHVINTHCDFDHQGGNSAMLEACPAASLVCGVADRPEIESPDVVIERRYDAYRRDHAIFYDEAALAFIRRALGAPQPVNRAFVGGEFVRLEKGRELEILHLPGHSHGHLGVLDRKHRTLFGGDAIHGSGCLDEQNRPALCPTYLHVQPYLETIRRIEHLALDTYVGCHWPVKRGAEIKAFCAESRSFVENAGQQILARMRGASEGVTLRELCLELGPQLGDWPASAHIELCYAFAGHLADFVERKLVVENRSTTPFTYHL